MNKEEHKHTNRLINETSPYLLQHSHNPVDWYPWGQEALEKAKNENKLLLISIGYSACHWCHVMERESFEDSTVAAFMNNNFVSIKVDREERPDVDQIYMDAVQLMTGRGGWPLNAIALPDGKPIFGGTYFKKDQWMQVLQQVHTKFITDPEETYEYAERLTEGVKQVDLIAVNDGPAAFKKETLDEVVSAWKKKFDPKYGGPNKAPKFPIPNNYQFLLRYAHLYDDQEVKDHVYLTLDKMIQGGIYDQIGGGFARYSTDKLWKVPHFEKMLYDNAQLVSLYSEAYTATQNPEYKKIVYHTLDFIERELMDKSFVFYSALDADSEGEEGRFYIWKEEELRKLLGEDYKLFSDFYNINNLGNWEHGNYILIRDRSEMSFATKNGITVDELQPKIESWRSKLMKVRDGRVRPSLDDKTLTSWNAMMTHAYANAFIAFDDERFLKVAKKNAEFITSTQMDSEWRLQHSYKNGISKINGYLEDYCFTIEALIKMYESTFEQEYLENAKALMNYSIEHFYDDKTGMFFFTSDLDANLVARKKELTDNVIPGSNSSMAKSLFVLGQYFDNASYSEMAEKMLNTIQSRFLTYPTGYSNWYLLMLNIIKPFYEVAISGKNANEIRQELAKTYVPNKMFIGAFAESDIPLLDSKYMDGETTIYVCVNKACKMPTTEVDQAIQQIEEWK